MTSAILQHRRDTAANWTSNNPTLAAGQIGFETDTKKWKLGDGTTAWTSLGYVSDHGLLAGLGDDDHTQYMPVNASRTFSACPKSAVAASGTDPTELVRQGEVDALYALILAGVAAGLAGKQDLDGELTAIAGLTSAADKVPFFTGSGTASLADFTTFGRSLVAAADAAAARTALGVSGSSPNYGTATLDFGSGDGSCEASVVVTGQTSIVGTSRVEVFVMGSDTTADHTASDHRYLPLLASFTAGAVDAGVGFTIYATALDKLTGQFQVRWRWQ